MNSLWVETAIKPRFGRLKEDLKTEVLVIGGGLAGLLVAYELKKAGVDYALVEAEEICGGVTKNTTAKITAQHGLCYHQLLSRFGEERAKAYLEANSAAVEKYRALCEGIDCEFEEKDSFVYSTQNARALEREMHALEKLGAEASFVQHLPLPFKTKGAVRFKGQAQFHPLKFAYALAKDLRIYEGTRILEITENGATFDGGKIESEKTVVCTHFPLLNKRGLYFLKLFQHRSYVLALENAQKLDGTYVDEDEKGLSFRESGGYLLLGGGSHRTGGKGGNYRELESFARTHYPKAETRYRWATQDCMTLDGIPYIGRYAENTERLFVATGFNKWGVTSSMVAANLLKNAVLGEKDPYAEAFSPSRSILRKQLFLNAAKSVLGLLTPTAPRCPHMGCALRYNPQERTWDCPCHGSRFTEGGKLIDNPANVDMKK